MDHHRATAAKAALAVALTIVAAGARAEVTWEIVGIGAGEADLSGTSTTNDIPVSCSFGPPSGCPISGTLTIPAGALGGPGTTIDLGADPENVIINISTSPPTVVDDFFLLTISKNGYTCNSSSSFVLQCDYDNTTASYDLALTEQVPSVAIGNGNVVITGQLLINGQPVTTGNPPTVYDIGDTGPAGGIVIHITDGGLHGLEAARYDQGVAEWGCDGRLTGATRVGVFAGDNNTIDILVACQTTDIAGRLADAYSLNGFDDWYLPSKQELNLLYLQRDDLGGFADAFYSSSSEADDVVAWCQYFPGGAQTGCGKINALHVRAVRAF